MKHTDYRLYSALPSLSGARARAEISISALQNNYRVLTELICSRAQGQKQPSVMAIVKADAYGHGIPICVPALLEMGCRSFSVATPEEAAAVRKICDENAVPATVLLLGWSDPKEALFYDRYRITLSLLSLSHAQALSEIAQGLELHLPCQIALDCGMHRIGIDSSTPSAADEIAKILALPGLNVCGAFSHFSRADEETPQADALTALQFERFSALTAPLKQEGFLRHICNSAAALRFPAFYLDAVRLGLALYGVSPLCNKISELAPVLSLKTQIISLRSLAPMEPLGYGGAFQKSTPALIATVPVGYADGFLRAYSKASVVIHTRSGDFCAPIAGRICMDQCMLDVTNIPAKLGDEVTLFENASALSSTSHIIPYEILTSLSARIIRRGRP